MKTNFVKYLAGRSVSDIARDIGVTRQNVYAWMNGKQAPHPLRVQEILTVLGIPYGRILSEEEVWPEGIDGNRVLGER